jgi:hypothetical protein
LLKEFHNGKQKIQKRMYLLFTHITPEVLKESVLAAGWDIRVPCVTLQIGKKTEIIVRVSQIMAFTL